MKINSLLVIILIIVLPIGLTAQNKLTFRDGKLIIAQFTDLHWMPNSPKCAETEATIRAVILREQPHIAILSGDVVTADPAMEGWRQVIRIFEDLKIPFVVTMGNHDAEYLTRDQIYDFLIKSPYYMGHKGAKEIMGCGNCVIPLYGGNPKSSVAALLYCIDSNDYQPNKLYGAYDWIHFDQIDWYRKQSTRFTKNNGGEPLPALAFFHIALPEFDEIRGDGKTFGHDLEGGIGASKVNSGMFASFLDMKDVMGMFVGHDHDNDYLGINKGVAMGYGRVTGSDAYGDLPRGARIIQLYENQFKFDSWISTASGREDAYYFPSGLNSADERTMSFLPATRVMNPKPGVAYTYYEGKCKKIADIASSRKIKDGVMANFSIQEAASTDSFAYEFHAMIDIPEKGVYRFYTFSDDGSKLFIDDQLVVDNDGGHSARRAEGKIALEKGFHKVFVQYFENYMGQEFEVGFSGRNIEETILPASILFQPQ